MLSFVGVRRVGFDPPVHWNLTGLPAGVSVKVSDLPAGVFVTPVVFDATSSAEMAGAFVDVSASSMDASQPVTGKLRQRVPLIQGPGDALYQFIDVDRLAVAVAREAKFAVDVMTPAGPFPVDGTYELLVKVTRQEGTHEPLDISFPVLPHGLEGPAVVRFDGDVTERSVPLIIHPWAEVGTGQLVAEASPAVGARSQRDPLLVGMNGLGTMASSASDTRSGAVCSDLVKVEIAASPIVGTLDSAAARQGESISFCCVFNQALPGSFQAQLSGLPPRVSSSAVDLAAGAEKVTFAIQVDPTTPEGDYRTLACELHGLLGTQQVTYRIGSRTGSLRIDSPTSDRIDSDGKPISKLEALRRRSLKETAP
jgi:hypothetical protein